MFSIWQESLILPIISLILSIIGPTEISEETKQRIFETSFNTVITSLRSAGFRATYDEIKIVSSSDSIEAKNIVIGYPTSKINYQECLPDGYENDGQLFPETSNYFNDCFINLNIETFSIKNIGIKKKSKENLIIGLSGIAFDLNGLTKVLDGELAGLNVVASVIADDQKLKGDLSIESGYSFNQDKTAIGFNLKLDKLADLKIKANVSNPKYFNDRYTYSGIDDFTFNFNDFEFTYKDLGLRKLLEFLSLSMTGQKISSDLTSFIVISNEAEAKKLAVINKFLDGASKITCSRKTSIYFSSQMYSETLSDNPMTLLNFFCEDLKSY